MSIPQRPNDQPSEGAPATGKSPGKPAVGVPPGMEDQEPKGLPNSDRHKTETAPNKIEKPDR